VELAQQNINHPGAVEMKMTETESALRGGQLAMTRYIPWLLQTLLLLTVLPYLSLDGIGQMALGKDGAIFATLLLLFLIAAKAEKPSMLTVLVLADTVAVSYLFMSLRPGEAFLPYPYFVILMIAVLGQNTRHMAASVALLCSGYLEVLYHQHLLSQQYLLLLPVMVTMAALVTGHVFRSELLATHATRIQQHIAVDTLTGLPNRAAFLDCVWDSIHLARRFSEDLFAVLFIDLDGFKAVNDQHGHRAGDELLRGMAGRLKPVLRKGDVMARYGGDEFCVLLTRVSSKAEALRIGERLLEKVKAPMVVGSGRAVTVGASIGIALSSNIHDRPEDLIRDADAAMYRVKQRGKNGIGFSDQLGDFASFASPASAQPAQT
jgi:diguanylate cyclase (GGDEF)-like protein